jgi:hypothetical protein
MKYSIEDTTLTALGDAVRAKVGETRMEDAMIKKHVIDIYDTSSPSGHEYIEIAKYKLPGVKKVKLTLLNGSLDDFLEVYIIADERAHNFSKELDENNESIVELRDNDGNISFNVGYNYNTHCYMEVNLTFYHANGNQYTFLKEVPNTLTPAQMVKEINNMPDPPPKTTFKITRNCNYRFANGGWDWFIEQYGDKITTEDIHSASNMFSSSNVKEIPFDINMTVPTIDYMFSSCINLTTIPNVNFEEITSHKAYGNVFRGCYMIQELPDWLGDLLEADYNVAGTNGSWRPWAEMFYNCTNLRRIPDKVMRYMKNDNTSGQYYGLFYSKPFYNNQALDELVNIHCDGCELTSNLIGTFCTGLYRAKDITFATEEDGTPCVRKWKNQLIDLGSYQYIGWGPKGVISLTFTYIPESKKVIDDATYQALKDDPDWYTDEQAYSRYNHDSAVNTINSLPDTSAYLASAGGTNIIKFEGASGRLTDGGAINTLTDEEIAVAAAKGWTVSLV